MIVYFSGTGNSRYCAQFLADNLEDELLDAGHYIRHQIAADLISGKAWVFVCPTYAWQMPHIFRDFIHTGNFSGAEDAWFLMTCGEDIGSAGTYIQALCEEKGLRFRGVLSVVMPENYIAMFDVPDSREAAELIANARPTLSNAAALIRRNESFPPQPLTLADKFKTRAINPVFYKLFVRASPFYAKDSCISCGKCQSLCVLNNIRLQNGKPTWGANCTHCMACICGCPTQAIEYGKKSIGKPRYQCPNTSPS